ILGTFGGEGLEVRQLRGAYLADHEQAGRAIGSYVRERFQEEGEAVLVAQLAAEAEHRLLRRDPALRPPRRIARPAAEAPEIDGVRDRLGRAARDDRDLLRELLGDRGHEVGALERPFQAREVTRREDHAIDVVAAR